MSEAAAIQEQLAERLRQRGAPDAVQREATAQLLPAARLGALLGREGAADLALVLYYNVQARGGAAQNQDQQLLDVLL